LLMSNKPMRKARHCLSPLLSLTLSPAKPVKRGPGASLRDLMLGFEIKPSVVFKIQFQSIAGRVHRYADVHL
jgi:hypothetical protein